MWEVLRYVPNPMAEVSHIDWPELTKKEFSWITAEEIWEESVGWVGVMELVPAGSLQGCRLLGREPNSTFLQFETVEWMLPFGAIKLGMFMCVLFCLFKKNKTTFCHVLN